MKKLLLFLVVFTFSISGFSQNFFREDFNHHKKYVILTNPTVNNLKTIQYLVNARLLDVARKVKFVGVYYEGQNYNFGKTRKYIDEKGLKNFFLFEIRGALNESNIYKDNACTADLKTIFENSVGVFFFDGPDIPPAIYGKENTRSVVTDPNRHLFEATFLYHLLGGFQHENYQPLLDEKPGYLVTGFCLGMQTMNIATGGTLIQDIPAELYGAKTPEEALKIGRTNLHHNYWKDIDNDTLLMSCNLHTLTFTDNPFFGNVVNVPKRWNPRVYSNHHQATEKLGKGMEVTAVSPDGKIVEGLVHERFPNVFAVQFHPEVPALYEDLYVRKFHPEDEPLSYNDIIGKQSVKFHERYWDHISEIIRKAKNKVKK
ncbi:MAG TPA: gamma-glutamyl-gamma-aminobutyrate hydrolase family protein [Draconibacterium sp.]|nr:gamma-glutamyl-gamma-aminobutyrate hydrolase family protein [Draconibacterium sp.]